MAAENEIQFFEAPFQYQIGEFKSNVNLTYHKLINTVPVKMPQLNTWFETNFSQAEHEKWDKAYFWITKRKWFERCRNLDEKVWEWLEWEYDYIITDHQILDWQRFMMVCNPSFSKMCILYAPAWRYVDCIPQPQEVCSAAWEIKWWVWREQIWNSFKTTPCAYHKFQKITTLQSSEPAKSLWNLYIWTVVYEWWSTTSVLFNEKMSLIDWAIVWKFIQPYDSEDNNIVVWQALQIWQFDASQWWYNMWYWSWSWVTDVTQRDIFDEDWNKIWVLNYQWPVKCYMYDEAKLWIAFAGMRENYSWTNLNWIWEWDWNRFIFQMQTNISNSNITSLTEDFDWLVYTTDRWVLNFMRPHTNTWQSMWWTIYSTHTMYWWWDLAKACWDYIFLFWPETMWIAYKNWTDERWDYRWNVQVLDRNLWYRSKDSVLVYNEELYMIDNKKRFVKLDLQATTDSYYRVHFKLTATDMSLHWINTDLRNLNRERWDRAILCKEWTRIYIIINDSYDEDDDEDNMNTKILVYEDELKYRHRRYLCWIDIRWMHQWVWFWRYLWLYQWDKDKNRYFKQIISMTFWDTSWFTWKELLWIKAWIWYHSKIDENTKFVFRADGWWFSTTFKMNDFDKSVNYIKTINELHESWKTNLDNMESLYHAMPIWIWVFSWNWVWLQKDIYRTAITEFDQYCNYEPTMWYNPGECCDPKPASEVSGNGCTMKPPRHDRQNFGSDRFQYHYNIAKYSTMKINVWQQWQNFYFELIANEDNVIEFLWFMIWWMFMDNNYDNIANTPYYMSTPKDSLPWTK